MHSYCDAQEKRNEGKNRREIHNIKSWMKKRDENSQPEMLEGAKSMGAGAATIASAGAAVGIGNVFSSLIHSVARNPSLAKQSFGYAILGFALTEAIASFAPMMAFLISSVFRSKKEGFSLIKQDLFHIRKWRRAWVRSKTIPHERGPDKFPLWEAG